ncbi:MAG: hypothetical protein A2X32_09820 [Elusimicrobia bacterium GWC2_64_44]|nr:MAG: hypothetical protein A2X32_09820 [Elusimicrobia bacterium GWC2_64_44]
MKKSCLICLGAALCAAAPAGASAAQKYELGVIVGEPTGLSGKMDLAGGGAMDAALAWSTTGEDKLSFHADRLWYKRDVFSPKEGSLPVYYGVGGSIKLEDKSRLGARFPVGLQYFFKDVRFTAFLELAPIMDLLPDTEFRLSAAAGFRIIF